MVIFILFIIFYIIFYFIEMFTFSKSRYLIEDKKIKENFTIVHLSDFHCMEFPFKNKFLLKKIKKIRPNIIVVTGDIAMYNKDINKSFLLLAQLKKIAPVYFVSGNHDFFDIKNDFIIRKLKELGIIIAENKFIHVTNSICLFGLSDEFDSNNLKDREKAYREKKEYLEMINVDEGKYNVLLTHRPYDFKLFSNYFDLTLCGHTHGGQWIFPFLGGFIYPDKKAFFPKYDYGLKEEFGKKMIINRGLGGPMKVIRLFNRPEIGIIKFVKQK